MSAKYLAITLFFALAVIKPIHDVYDKPSNDSKNETESFSSILYRSISEDLVSRNAMTLNDISDGQRSDYLWMYIVFAYTFSILLMFTIVSNTREVIEVRQEYLGTRTTITDRTFRLSGIPPELQSEDKIKSFMAELDIGRVESVSLCRNWSELDAAIRRRDGILRKLEAALAIYHQNTAKSGNVASLPTTYRDQENGNLIDDQTSRFRDNEDEEDNQILGNQRQPHHHHPRLATGNPDRPVEKIRFGKFWLQSKSIDAIDYHEERLRRADSRIEELREKEFPTTPMAFVTMDSVAACQMATQAVLDSSPLQFVASPSPAPADVVWENTYLPRRQRMWQAWSITAAIVVMTVFWSVLLVPVAAALNPTTIRKVIPPFGTWLESHTFASYLVETQLPTVFGSLLNVAVPYLYEWLANCQGMTGRSDIELSAISKNFFFTFFNFFVVLTVLGTASNAWSLVSSIEDGLRNTTTILHTLAKSLAGLISFYTNYLILQAFGLLPFKLLQVGSLSLYPFYRIGAKTPRDHAELVRPPIFSYGMYLPQTLLIFDICLVYSVLPHSWQILLCGLAYFLIGGVVYKYQLLYAMDQRQHTTGRSWIMMCDRVLVGLVVFQLTVGGQLILKKIDARGALLLPLVIGTIWFAYAYNNTYRPLMKFIALKSVRRAEHDNQEYIPEDLARWRESSETRSGVHTPAEEDRPKFMNPNLVIP